MTVRVTVRVTLVVTVRVRIRVTLVETVRFDIQSDGQSGASSFLGDLRFSVTISFLILIQVLPCLAFETLGHRFHGDYAVSNPVHPFKRLELSQNLSTTVNLCKKRLEKP